MTQPSDAPRQPLELSQVAVAHDLKNQLGTMLVTIQLLQEDLQAADAPELLEALAHATRSARDLAQQLLTSDRLPGTQPFLLGKVVADACRAHRPALIQSNIRLNLHDEQVPVLGDMAQVRRIVDNLLENARAADGVQWVDVRVSRLGQVDVLSQGTHLSDTVAGSLFEPYASSQGGLGLFISRWMARRMGGDLILASRQPVTFRLSLPATEVA